MRLVLETRPEPSRIAGWLSPLFAVVATVLIGVIVFSVLGKDPLQAMHVFFIKPLETRYGVGEWLLKAGPLMLCAVGLAVGYRANVWNIGAEGQLTLGGVLAGGLALLFDESTGHWLLPAMFIAGAIGGMLWAAIAAWLRTHFNANEVLTSLMLVYVANFLLSYLVHGPWRDPQGFNFPQSKMFADAAMWPNILSETRLNAGFIIALVIVAVLWLFMSRSVIGFEMRVAGLAPAAARYAGISSDRTVWIGLLVGGACAGIAGVNEIAGPLGQLQPSISPGYGFAAIIVAFVGRLHAFGIVLASLLMSLLYLGGESAQLSLALPSAVTGLFQGTLLFFLLAADVFIRYRLRWTSVSPAGVPR